jgi:hypothetical protein
MAARRVGLLRKTPKRVSIASYINGEKVEKNMLARYIVQ